MSLNIFPGMTEAYLAGLQTWQHCLILQVSTFFFAPADVAQSSQTGRMRRASSQLGQQRFLISALGLRKTLLSKMFLQRCLRLNTLSVLSKWFYQEIVSCINTRQHCTEDVILQEGESSADFISPLAWIFSCKWMMLSYPLGLQI